MIAKTSRALGSLLFVWAVGCGGQTMNSNGSEDQDGGSTGDDAMASTRSDAGRRPSPDAGSGGGIDAGGGGRADGSAGACVPATRLFFEDFETGDYRRWTGASYGDDWNGGRCHSTATSDERSMSGSSAQRSEITCSYQRDPHRGYGGLQFDGDEVMARYTNQGTGIDAPFGVVNTYWSWLDAPYLFGDGKWFSFFTVNSACDYSERVITLSLEDETSRITPAHIINTGGTVRFERNAPGFPMREWVRTTIYINYVEGEMIVWMNGARIFTADFSRPTTDMCQWHWGAYASGDNDQVVLFEDDISLWKLGARLEDRVAEPWLDGDAPPCP